jgi:hypothetical protein
MLHIVCLLAKLAIFRTFIENYLFNSMKHFFTAALIFFTVLSTSVHGFDGVGIIGGRSGGLGKASVSLTDFWAIQNNPAGMAMQKDISAGIAYENRFMLKELGLKSVAFIMPVKFGVLGLSYNQFGYNLYNENKVGLAYARAFGPRLRIGLQLDYLSTSFAEGYEGFNNVTFEFGVQSNINDKLAVGAYIFNPARVTLSEVTNERVPIILRFGISYQFTEKLLAVADIEKNFDFEPDVRIGLEYLLNETFYLRTGLAVNPGLFTFGTGMQISGLRFDVAASLHQVLGANIQGGIIYSFGNTSK